MSSFLRRFKKAILPLVPLLLVACGDDGPLTPLASDSVILAYGDSLTKGKGVSEEHSYPAVLEKLSGRKVINAGVSGEVSDSGLLRLPGVINKTNPSLLLLMHGGNDILQNRSETKAQDNLREMIKLARSENIEVVLIGIPEKKILSSTAPVYTRLAKEFELVFEDSIIASLIKKPSMKSDSVHFNKAGYKAIATRIDKLLRDNGAL